ncbi:MAG: hypothetical protein JNM79_25710 [Burkholderiales bacterium]|nr:hypothetical protein [Burkholderiales bacterium]
MKRSVTVSLGETAIEVGTLVFEASGNRRLGSFAYADAWLASPACFALSPDAPLVSGYQFLAIKGTQRSARSIVPSDWSRART